MSEARPKQRADLLARDMGDETVLYDNDSGSVHVLNATGQVIWRLCDGQRSVEDMAAFLRLTFRIDASIDVNRDVLETLADLRVNQLIV